MEISEILLHLMEIHCNGILECPGGTDEVSCHSTGRAILYLQPINNIPFPVGNIQYPDFKLAISPTFWQYPISSFEGCRALDMYVMGRE